MENMSGATETTGWTFQENDASGLSEMLDIFAIVRKNHT